MKCKSKNILQMTRFYASICCLFLMSAVGLASQQGAPQPKPIPASTAISKEAPGTDWRDAAVKNSNAHVTIIEFFDYQCPFCRLTNPALEDAMRKHPAKIRLVLKNLPLSIHPDSMLAHQAALAAAEQGRFWEMHDLLFTNQKNMKLPDLLQYAERLHLDTKRFTEALKDGRFRSVIEDDEAMARGLGISGTPAFFINGKLFVGQQSAERLNAAIDQALNPARSVAAQPARISASQLDLARAPVRGKAGAPVTIVEFSDLQCPFCAKVSPTLQQLVQLYPDQVRWVFKNYPLDFHANSPLAHAAALAAGRQGKFWEMHDLIFTHQHNLKRDDLLAEARSLELDMARFTTDLDSAQIKQQIEADKKEGAALAVNGTPAFFINGKSFSGAMPIEQFQSVINNELTALSKPPLQPAPSAKPIASRNTPEISFGSSDSPITLTWFSDLESGLTARAAALVRDLVRSHPGQIRLVFKNRPLEMHPEAMLLHEAAMAANAQGKFWQMEDLIAANPKRAGRQDLVAYAQTIGLNLDRFQKDLDSGKYRPLIEADIEEAQRRAVLGSPVFFLNAARVDGLQREKLFEEIIDSQLATKK